MNLMHAKRRHPGLVKAGIATADDPSLTADRQAETASMSRRHCPECGPESLDARVICCGCGRDSTPGKLRAKRMPRAIAIKGR